MQPIECIINFYFDDNVNAMHAARQRIAIPIQLNAIKPNLTSLSAKLTSLPRTLHTHTGDRL